MPENMNEIPDIFKEFSCKLYRVYRINNAPCYGFPKGMIYSTSTDIIEPDDITESPLTKKEAVAYIQHRNPGMKKGTLDKLVKSYGLQKHRYSGYCGYVYLRSEVRAAIEQLVKA